MDNENYGDVFDVSTEDEKAFRDSIKTRKNFKPVALWTLGFLAVGVCAFGLWWSVAQDSPQSHTDVVGEIHNPVYVNKGDKSQSGVPQEFRLGDEDSIRKYYGADFDKIASLPDWQNPLKISPFGIWAYNVDVPEEWKESYEGAWVSLVPQILSRFEGLHAVDVFHGEAFDEALKNDRMNELNEATEGDKILSRFAGINGIDYGKPTPLPKDETQAKWLAGITPVLYEGRIPGTDIKPENPHYRVDVANVVVQPASDDVVDGIDVSTNPKITFTRFISYDDDAIVVEQNVEVWCSWDGDSWRIFDVRASDVTR